MAALSTATAATAATAAPAFLSCIDHIEEGLAGDGYAVLNHAFGAQLSDDCRAEIETMHQNNLLRKATIQSGIQSTASTSRSDLHTFLSSDSDATEAEKYPNLHALRAWLQELRVQLASCIERLEGVRADRASFMCAKYPAHTAGYLRHRDAKPEIGGRKLTCLCYFNNDWAAEHGGQLRIWPQGSDDSISFVDIDPIGGRMVVFRSSLWHQVFPTEDRDRYALTAWLTNHISLAAEIIEEEREQLKQKLLRKAAAFLMLKRKMMNR